jgi:MFS family permease
LTQAGEVDRAPKLSPAVYRLGVVSLLTDVAGDVVTTLLPFFLMGPLGASFGFVGVVDGAADALSSFLKVVSGRLGDGRLPKKRLVLSGYALAGLARPLLAFATLPLHVLLIRVTDRIGKGIRTAPRDAWIADVTPEGSRGRAYGVHRALDNLGSFLGPLVALVLYRGLGLPLPTVFLLTIVPGALAVLLLWVTPEPAPGAVKAPKTAIAGPLPMRLRAFLLVAFAFALANASDAFVLLLGREVGLDETWILGGWIAFAGLRTLTIAPGSALSDRIGRRTTLLFGWLLYAAVYFAFSLATTPLHWALILVVYTGYYGLTEGAERALVADLAPEAQRGSAFGWFHGLIGAALLPASAAFGWIADQWDLATAFRTSAVISLVASAGLVAVLRTWPSARC